MDILKDHEILKLALLAGAFVIAVTVCLFIAIRETVDLNRRRKAKRLLEKAGKSGGRVTA